MISVGGALVSPFGCQQQLWRRRKASKQIPHVVSTQILLYSRHVRDSVCVTCLRGGGAQGGWHSGNLVRRLEVLRSTPPWHVQAKLEQDLQ